MSATMAVLVIDIQRDYFPGGEYPLVGADAAAGQARAIVLRARQDGVPVIHIRHESLEAGATFFVPGTPGTAIDERLAPVDGELVITKNYPNSFLATGLRDALEGGGVDELVIVGMMSSMCVDATTRAALDLDFAVTVIHDACAAPDLAFDGNVIPGATVHAAFMAALTDAGAEVIAAANFTARE
ncbi:MAG TPA: cysteine hydrolase family protein [Galbitalea sp.]|jgi:nicotinamidase-related amidase